MSTYILTFLSFLLLFLQSVAKVRNQLLQAAVDMVAGIIVDDLLSFLREIDLRSQKWESELDRKIGRLLDAPADTAFLDEGYQPGTRVLHGYVCANLMMMATNVSEEMANAFATSLWEQILHALRERLLGHTAPVPRHLVLANSGQHAAYASSKQNQLYETFQEKLGSSISFILDQLILFFSDDGDGVPYQDLIQVSNAVLDPVLNASQMNTVDLVSHFLQKAANEQAIPIRLADKKFRKSGEKMDLSPPTIEVDQIGQILLHINYDHAEDVLSIAMVDSTGVKSAGLKTYLKIRRLPQSAEIPSTWRSDRQKRGDDAQIVEIPQLSQEGTALQLRLHQYSPFKTQKQSTRGEILLSIQTLCETTRELYVWLPLYSPHLEGHLGELQHLIHERAALKTDVEANHFSKLYPAAPKKDKKLGGTISWGGGL